MDKLVNNYEKRINTFVLQMAENPMKKIILLI